MNCVKKHSLLFFFCLGLFFSCKKSIQTPTEETHKSDISTAVKHKPYTKLTSTAMEMIKGWEAYYEIEDHLKNYDEISAEQVFNDVNELKEITKELKDSLNVDILKTPAFKSRLNVFENEVLRLEDMSNISAITSSQANAQIAKVLMLFSSLNHKINTVNSQQIYNEEINLEDFFIVERDSMQKVKTEKKTTTDERLKEEMDRYKGNLLEKE